MRAEEGDECCDVAIPLPLLLSAYYAQFYYANTLTLCTLNYILFTSERVVFIQFGMFYHKVAGKNLAAVQYDI